jgi:hypothetical protein
MKKSILASLLASFLVVGLHSSATWGATIKAGGSCEKAGKISHSGSKNLICKKSGKKLLWVEVKSVQPKPLPSPLATSMPTPSPSAKPAIAYYEAKDQKTIRLINASEACSNPANADFEIQAKVGEMWLPVRTIEKGWKPSTDCSNPALGKRNDFGWAKFYMDEGTTYRWVFSGEINMEFRDAQGRGISKTAVIPVSFVPVVINRDPSQTPLKVLTDSAKSALENVDLNIPILSPTEGVSVSANGLMNSSAFIPATTKGSYSFIGPTPLAETSIDRVGAVSLITRDNRLAYQSQSALPPWGAAFTFTTSDSLGRFTVVTSAIGNNSQSSWRLAYKKGSGEWQYQSVTGTLHPTDNAKYFDLVTLGAPGTYSIKLEFEWHTTFYGISPSDSQSTVVALETKTPLRVMVIGDSWTYPVITDSGSFTQWDGYPLALTYLSGWNVMAAGVPGQGYLKAAAGETYKDRVMRDVLPENPDVVIFTGSPNDHCQNCSFTDQQIAQAAGEDIQLLQKLDPHALIILCSPFSGSQSQSNEMNTVAASLGVPFIDFISTPLLTPANNGQNQLVNGHPTRAGGAYIANEILKAISALK